jgi:hypothetical protein
MNIIEVIKEFIQKFLSSAMLQKVVAVLQVAVEWVKKLIDWLYGTVAGWLK